MFIINLIVFRLLLMCLSLNVVIDGFASKIYGKLFILGLFLRSIQTEHTTIRKKPEINIFSIHRRTPIIHEIERQGHLT